MAKEIGFARDTDEGELAWRRLKEATEKACHWLGKMNEALEGVEEVEDGDGEDTE